VGIFAISFHLKLEAHMNEYHPLRKEDLSKKIWKVLFTPPFFTPYKHPSLRIKFQSAPPLLKDNKYAKFGFI
jgi:hypothetical protein